MLRLQVHKVDTQTEQEGAFEGKLCVRSRILGAFFSFKTHLERYKKKMCIVMGNLISRKIWCLLLVILSLPWEKESTELHMIPINQYYVSPMAGIFSLFSRLQLYSTVFPF